MPDFHLALDGAEGDTVGPVYDAGQWCRSVAFDVHGEPAQNGALGVGDFLIQSSWDGDQDGPWYTLFRQQEPSVVRNTSDNPHDRHFQMWLTPDRHHPHVARYYRMVVTGVSGKITGRLLAFDPVTTAGPGRQA